MWKLNDVWRNTLKRSGGRTDYNEWGWWRTCYCFQTWGILLHSERLWIWRMHQHGNSPLHGQYFVLGRMWTDFLRSSFKRYEGVLSTRGTTGLHLQWLSQCCLAMAVLLLLYIIYCHARLVRAMGTIAVKHFGERRFERRLISCTQYNCDPLTVSNSNSNCTLTIIHNTGFWIFGFLDFGIFGFLDC